MAENFSSEIQIAVSLNPNMRARLEEGHGSGPLRYYRTVTPLGWGEQYHAKIFVSRESMRLIEARGGNRV